MKPPNLCVVCKGKGLCGKPCPIVGKTAFAKRVKPGTTLFGSSPPSVFVGRYGYPNVKAGIVAPDSPDAEAWKLDDPRHWTRERLDITDLIGMRSSLVNSQFSVDVKRPSRTNDVFRELTMAERPADVEVDLGRVKVDVKFSGFHAPLGPTAEMKQARLAENARIPKRVDAAVEERRLAGETVIELYEHGFPVKHLQRLLSAGLLGKEKKMVPTRWSITATDDILSKHLLEEVRRLPEMDCWEVYHHEYLDNDYHVILFPRKWAFEQVEAYSDSVWGSGVASDHELYYGRKSYASSVTGAYYAARLAVAEKLVEKGRQAAALVVRTVGKGYFAPLGVWQVRENVRSALQERPVRFSSEKAALSHLSSRSRLGARAVSESALLRGWRRQPTLQSFSKS